MNLSTFNAFKNLDAASGVTIDDEGLQLLHEVLLVILDDVTSFCESNHIDYVLSGGSCLGAMRHKGFVPWDDDIDIDMPRESYDRFIKLFPQVFGDKYLVQSPELTPEVGTTQGHVRLRGTTMRLHDDVMLEDAGICIDIFPIENTYNNPIARNLHGFACLSAGFLFSCRRFWRDRKFYAELGKGNASFLRTARIKAAIGLPCALLSTETWSSIVTRVYSMCKNSESEMVAVPSGRGHFYGELLPRAKFAESRMEKFEGRDVRVPRDAEGYLEQHYGDWQTVPPAENREYHTYLALDFGPYAP